MDRRAKLLSDIDLDRDCGLEIGPLASPIIPKFASRGVSYADHCSTDDLVAKYATEVAAEKIVGIDVVWSAGCLKDAVGGRTFDYVVASHIIEHVPNLIGWLEEIAGVLRPGGILALAVPDKRYTFDVARPLSTVGEIIGAHVGAHVIPSVQQVYDNYTMARAVDAASLWDGSQDAETAPHLHPRGVAAAFVERVVFDDYVDCHCWIFTPRSFLDVLRALAAEGYVSFGVRRFFDSAPGENEFIVILTSPAPEPQSYLVPEASGETVDVGPL
jgi:SAM-dependent methyltransferase